MKYTIFLSIVLTGTLFAATLSIKDIDQKVAQIGAPRGGLNSSIFNVVSDPFVYYDRNKTTGAIIMPRETDEDFNVTKLSAIMNGKAFIGGSWKKVGDAAAGGYTITKIGQSSVFLNNGKKTKKVHLNRGLNEKKLIKF